MNSKTKTNNVKIAISKEYKSSDLDDALKELDEQYKK